MAYMNYINWMDLDYLEEAFSKNRDIYEVEQVINGLIKLKGTTSYTKWDKMVQTVAKIASKLDFAIDYQEEEELVKEEEKGEEKEKKAEEENEKGDEQEDEDEEREDEEEEDEEDIGEDRDGEDEEFLKHLEIETKKMYQARLRQTIDLELGASIYWPRNEEIKVQGDILYSLMIDYCKEECPNRKMTIQHILHTFLRHCAPLWKQGWQCRKPSAKFIAPEGVCIKEQSLLCTLLEWICHWNPKIRGMPKKAQEEHRQMQLMLLNLIEEKIVKVNLPISTFLTTPSSKPDKLNSILAKLRQKAIY